MAQVQESNEYTDVDAKGSPGLDVYPSSIGNSYIIVDWDGPLDPENPRNWSKTRKWVISSFGIAFLGLVGMANASYSSSQPSLEQTFGISHIVGTMGIVTFTLAFGLSPLVLAPFSELFGRLPIYIISVLVFWIMILPVALAQNFETVLISRFVSGIGASTSVAIVGGILADLWNTEERGLPMAIFSSLAFIGTGIGPVSLGYIEFSLGFRFVNWIIFGLSGLCALAIILATRETRASVLLIRKARYLRKESGNSSYVAKEELNSTSMMEIMKESLCRPLKMLFTEPLLFIFCIWITYAWGILYLMLEAIPIVFTEVYNFNAGENGLVFMGEIIGPLIGIVINIWCDRAYHQNVANKGPEARLYIAMVSGVLLPIGCWIYAWTSSPTISWAAPASAICIIYAAMFGIYLASFNYVTDSYTLYASSALGGQSAVRLTAGACFSLIAIPMYANLDVRTAGSILAGLSTLFAVTPFLLYRYGAKIRSKSKFAGELGVSLTRDCPKA